MQKLLNNSSWGLLRTNPMLSSNLKLSLLSNGNFELNSFSTGKILNQIKYKKFKTNKNSSWSKDISKFWMETSPDQIFNSYIPVNDEKVTDRFDKQVNTFYSYGAERVNSPLWKEEFKILAPLWIKDTLPTKFIVFKLPNPLNTELGKVDISEFELKDSRWFLNEEQVEIVKVFDLSNKSDIGEYLINHRDLISAETRPLFASFNQNQFSEYRGVSLNSGTIVNIPEDNFSSMAINDTSQIEYDDFITSGFKRNKVICANIINLEFFFDDTKARDFTINRYLGLYVQEFEDETVTALSVNNNKLTIKEDLDISKFDSESSINYLKINESDFKVIDSIQENTINTILPIDYLDLFKANNQLKAFRENNGRDYLMITIEGQPLHGDEYTITNIGKVIADYTLQPGENVNNRFSTRGATSSIASAMAKAINSKSDNEFLSISNGAVVVLFSRSSFSFIGNKYQITKSLIPNPKIKITGIENSDNFSWINFNTGFDKVVISSEIENLIQSEGNENIFVQALDNTYHNIDFVFRFLDKPIIDNSGKIVSFRNFNDFVSIQINYEIPIKLTNSGNLIIYKRSEYSKGRFSIFPVRDFDFDFNDKEMDLIQQYNKSDYTAVTSTTGIDVGHPNFEEFLEERRKWKIVDKGLDQIEFIDNSYDRLGDTSNPKLSTISRYSPYIVKWVAGKNVLNQDYRLNNSETFGLLNDSPSFLIKKQNHYYYTHEWYDLGVHPHWFNLDQKLSLPQYYDKPLNLGELILNTETDKFTEYFTVEKIKDNSNEYPIKTRIRYSEFDLFNRTFYKGVSIKLLERLESDIKINDNINSIQVKTTGKYNNYKFASILIPERNEISPKTSSEVIINEKWGWVLFVTKINLNQNLGILNDSSGDLRVDYPMLYKLKDRIKSLTGTPEGSYTFENVLYDIIYSDIFLSGFLDLSLTPGSRSETISGSWDIVAFETDSQGSIPNLLTELNVDSVGLFKEIRLYLKLTLNSYETSTNYIGVEVSDKISENSLKANRIYTNTFAGEVNITSELENKSFWESRKGVYINGGFNYFTGLIENISFSSIFEKFNSGSPEIKYRTILEDGSQITDNFIVRFEDPDLIPKITTLEQTPSDIPGNLFSSGLNVGISYKEKERPFVVSLQRYTNYYQPKFKDIFNFVDSLQATENERNKNLYFNYRDLVSSQYSDFKSQINKTIKVQGLKASNLVNKDSFIVSGRHPLINETALYEKELNIFTNNWDYGFYDNFVDKKKKEKITQVTSKEIKNFFGSKMTKLKDEILLESIPEKYYNLITNDNDIEIKFAIKEYLKLSIFNKLFPNVKDYLVSEINKEEFLMNYIEENLIDSYRLDEFKLWGVDTLIFDAFENTFDENELRDSNYNQIKSFLIFKDSDFDFKITKDLFEQNSFGVSIKYKLR